MALPNHPSAIVASDNGDNREGDDFSSGGEMTKDHQKLGGDDFSLRNRGDQTPHPQHQAGGSCKILQQHNGPAISGVPGVDLGPTFNRPLFGAVALSTGHGGEERTNKGGGNCQGWLGNPNWSAIDVNRTW